MTSVGTLYGECLRELGLADGLNLHKIYTAWDEASQAGKFTIDKYFRDGNLYIRLSSAVVRSRLYLRTDQIMAEINMRLSADAMFTLKNDDKAPVKNIILQ